MLQETTYDQFELLSKKSKRVVISQEIYADVLTPVRVFQVLSQGEEQAVLLDSSDHDTAEDACIYMGFDPFAHFYADKEGVHQSTEQGRTDLFGDVFEALRTFYKKYRSASQDSLAKFAGGMIGFMGYDSVRFIEDIPEQHEADALPLMSFKFYRTNLVFDKRTGKALITRVVDIESDLRESYESGMRANADLIKRILTASYTEPTAAKNEQADPFDGVRVDLDDATFKSLVTQAQQHIRSGDIFQIVLSRRFQKKFTGNDFDIYRALRLLNPSPYQFYIRDAQYTVVGSSPEKLASLSHGVVEVTPIAGTRARGEDYYSDKCMEQDLLSDEKELAEHMMLVDLGRNDLGRIAEVGSIKVKSFKKIKRFSRVMHLTACVQGSLAKGCDAFDVLPAVFPAGTLTGAPKIRAMELIDELESSARGLYGGAIIAIDNQGNMDSSIVIRTVVLQDGIATARAGAGVVLDSKPQLEANETRHKISAVLNALLLAEGGIV